MILVLIAMAKLAQERIAQVKEQEEADRKMREEAERLQKEEEDRIKAEEKRVADKRQRKRDEKKRRIDDMKKSGKYKTKKQREKERANKERADQMKRWMEEQEQQQEQAKKVDQDEDEKEEEVEEDEQEVEVIVDGEVDQDEIVEEVDQLKEEQNESGDDLFDDWEEMADNMDTLEFDLTLDEDEENQENGGGVTSPLSMDGSGGEDVDLNQLEKMREQEVLRQKMEDKEKKKHEEMEKKQEEQEMLLKRQQEAELKSVNEMLANMRSPIITVLGHVDTGKTTILDRVRNTNVQEKEEGGITQQIGSTFIPKENFMMSSSCCDEEEEEGLSNIDGLMVIDTPGHEAFTNLRRKGTSLADMAVLVVDLMHGLEPQTIESLNILQLTQTPFVVALNKIDRCYRWEETHPDYQTVTEDEEDEKKKHKNDWIKKSVEKIIKSREENTQVEFFDRVQFIKTQLMELGLNSALFYENERDEWSSTVSLVPTSGMTGEGIGDLLRFITRFSSKLLLSHLQLHPHQFDAVVMEVKLEEGFAGVMDVLLINGILHVGDEICIKLTNHQILITHIRALLLPPPLTDTKAKLEMVHVDCVRGSCGVRIACSSSCEMAMTSSYLSKKINLRTLPEEIVFKYNLKLQQEKEREQELLMYGGRRFEGDEENSDSEEWELSQEGREIIEFIWLGGDDNDSKADICGFKRISFAPEEGDELPCPVSFYENMVGNDSISESKAKEEDSLLTIQQCYESLSPHGVVICANSVGSLEAILYHLGFLNCSFL